ncbi:MAG: hypothetical protein JXR95_01405 [Deltaproteobacteria bacterium]|nr:hypothetical protein [Deltaproteobacteria bacterium]
MTDNSELDRYSIPMLAAEVGVSEGVVGFWLDEFSDIGFTADPEGYMDDKGYALGKLIYRLIYQEFFTLRGVKRRLRDFESNFLDTPQDGDINDSRIRGNLEFLRYEVNELLELISSIKK